MANEQNGRGLATSPSSQKCDICHKAKAEIPISSDDGEELEICEACDERLFGFTDFAEIKDIVLEALEDYRCWWCDNDDIDKEKRGQIDRAVEVIQSIPR